jgi:hypothetical protein
MNVTPIVQAPISHGSGAVQLGIVEAQSKEFHQFREWAEQQRSPWEEAQRHGQQVNWSKIERRYWSSLSTTAEPPQYGSDNLGTMFGPECSAHGWNIDRLDTEIQLLGDIPGVTRSMLYFGAWRSSFAWHKEDMDLFSLNLLHFGAPKFWYAIPPSAAARFEALVDSMFSSTRKETGCAFFLRHKTTLLSPQQLQRFGIPFVRAIHNPGEIMITYAGSYHSGFNTGFNCAESANFSAPEWWGVADRAVSTLCVCRPDHVRINLGMLKHELAEFASSGGETRWAPLRRSEALPVVSAAEARSPSELGPSRAFGGYMAYRAEVIDAMAPTAASSEATAPPLRKTQLQVAKCTLSEASGRKSLVEAAASLDPWRQMLIGYLTEWGTVKPPPGKSASRELPHVHVWIQWTDRYEYTGSIVDFGTGSIRVHYPGYKATDDEWHGIDDDCVSGLEDATPFCWRRPADWREQPMVLEQAVASSSWKGKLPSSLRVAHGAAVAYLEAGHWAVHGAEDDKDAEAPAGDWLPKRVRVRRRDREGEWGILGVDVNERGEALTVGQPSSSPSKGAVVGEKTKTTLPVGQPSSSPSKGAVVGEKTKTSLRAPKRVGVYDEEEGARAPARSPKRVKPESAAPAPTAAPVVAASVSSDGGRVPHSTNGAPLYPDAPSPRRRPQVDLVMYPSHSHGEADASRDTWAWPMPAEELQPPPSAAEQVHALIYSHEEGDQAVEVIPSLEWMF